MAEVGEKPDIGLAKSFFLCQVCTSNPGHQEMLPRHKAERIMILGNTSCTPDVTALS